MKKQLRSIIIVIILSLVSGTTYSQLKPCNVFSSGMVLQRNTELPVWGTSSAGETITVTLNGKLGTALANADGIWKATLPAMTYGGPYGMTISNGAETKSYTDVYIGDVWLCSGQSNMEMTVSGAANSAATIANANNQTIRQGNVLHGFADELSDELPATYWTSATSAHVGSFTAAGYYFARDIQPHIEGGDVPIGILNISYGGSRIEAWMSEQILGYDEKDVTLANGEKERQPTLIYNKMLNPVVGYPVKGFLWYQGESNADKMEDAKAYGDLFKTMITFWRNIWGMGDLPFIWVQLPNFYNEGNEDEPGTYDAWPRLRDGQSRALSLPNTGEAITIDVGEVDIHPKDKESVGKRLALITRNVAYGEDIVYNGPRYKAHRILDDRSVKIGFDHTGGGLTAKGVTDGKLKWFSCAGADGKLYRADAIIEDDSVVVSCTDVTKMEIIRYAWEYNPAGVNFYNAQDLPAAPFLINVQPQVFEIKKFTADKVLIERGQTILLEWETTGASYTEINGIEKSFEGSASLMPVDTITYELIAVNAKDNSDTLGKNIVVNVIDPLPRITVTTEFGNVYPPNEDIKIMADAYEPGGGNLQRVDFYINDSLIFSDTEKPYETVWKPKALGTYVIKGIVTNEAGATNQSEYTVYVNDLKRVRFEAEKASITGGGSTQSNSEASEGRYADLQADWTITFNINVPETGDYQSVIRYLMNYESPKEQNLSINGVDKGSLRFEGDDLTTWMDYGISLPLVKGNNTVTLTSSWGWMSFDYIDVLGANSDGTTPIKFSLTCSVNGQGSVSPSNGTYNEGAVVSLTAIPSAGWNFSSWGGDLSGSNTSATLTMNSNKSVTAKFSLVNAPKYTLTIDTTGQGTVKLSPAGGIYAQGTTVTLTAEPAGGYMFDNWSGALSGTSSSTTVSISSDLSITANFSPKTTGCTNPVSITAPIKQDGVGEFCWVTKDALSFVNSWNLDLLEINGVDFTNKWSTSLPSAADGQWEIHYIGSFGWSHFEANSLKSANGNLTDLNQVAVFPNPFIEAITLELNGQKASRIDLINSLGQLITTFSDEVLEGNSLEINIDSPGKLFFIKISTEDNVYIKTVIRK